MFDYRSFFFPLVSHVSSFFELFGQMMSQAKSNAMPRFCSMVWRTVLIWRLVRIRMVCGTKTMPRAVREIEDIISCWTTWCKMLRRKIVKKNVELFAYCWLGATYILKLPVLSIDLLTTNHLFGCRLLRCPNGCTNSLVCRWNFHLGWRTPYVRHKPIHLFSLFLWYVYYIYIHIFIIYLSIYIYIYIYIFHYI